MAATQGNRRTTSQMTPGDRPQRPDPADRPVGHDEDRADQPHEQQDEGTLQQHAGGHGGPEDAGQQPALCRSRRSALRQIDPRHGAERGEEDRHQHLVGAGEAALQIEHDGDREHERGQHGGAAADEGERRPIGQQHGGDRPDQRGDAIDPDAGHRRGHAQRHGTLHHRRLEPVDPGGLLVEILVLKMDVDVIAALDHLLADLGEERLVAIDRRNPEEARQDRKEGDDGQQQDGGPMAGRRAVEEAQEPDR